MTIGVHNIMPSDSGVGLFRNGFAAGTTVYSYICTGMDRQFCAIAEGLPLPVPEHGI